MGKTLAVFFCFITSVQAASINVAVTASFKPVIDRIAPLFSESTGISLNVSSASTGVLTQQIISGAPFDIFFAADEQRPRYVIETLPLPAERQQPYAFGKLVLVSQQGQYKVASDLNGYSDRLVIANPDHAPYGVAALQVLEAVDFNGDLVLASNVTQARQYLELNLAPAGLIAAAVAGGFEFVKEIDTSLYDLIEHHLVILQDNADTQALMAFLATEPVKNLLLEYGYQPTQ